MTAAAGFILLRSLHSMNRADPSRLRGAVPPDISTAGISLRCNSIQVAGSARHGGMKIVSYTFIMGTMALSAFPRSLVAVSKLRSLRVADQAVDILVGCLSILSFID